MLRAKFGYIGTEVLANFLKIKFSNVFSQFRYHLPSEIWTNLNPLYRRLLCINIGLNFGLVVPVKKTNMWKVYDDNDDDDGSGELKMIY